MTSGLEISLIKRKNLKISKDFRRYTRCMKSQIFIIFSLVLTVLWVVVFSAARNEYSGVKQFQSEAAHYKSLLQRQELKTALLEVQMSEFQQTVATLLPGKIPQNSEKFYPLRSLASSVTKKNPYVMQLVTAKNLMDRGKRDFRNGEFGKALPAFKTVIDHYSYSPEVTEAYFLYAEGLYQQRNYELCVQVIQTMIELFPGSELTGFAMLRLGRVFEVQKRSSEALDIYKTVVRSFPQRDLASQAVESIRLLEL